jgi:hypothetical protein
MHSKPKKRAKELTDMIVDFFGQRFAMTPITLPPDYVFDGDCLRPCPSLFVATLAITLTIQSH